MQKLAHLTIMTALGIGLATGCVGDEEAIFDDLDQGLTVIGAEDASFVAAYRNADVVIYMEAKRGKRTPDMYQSDPLSPEFEVDARLVADNGRTFWIQRGGDHFVEPTWAEDLARQHELPLVSVSNRLLFDLAAEAGLALESSVTTQVGAEHVASLSPELNALQRIGAQAPATYSTMRSQFDEYRQTRNMAVLEEIPYGDLAGPEPSDYNAGAGYYSIDVHDAYIGGDGWHTATRLQRWDGSNWVYAFDACNHGRCPFQNGAEHDCYVEYYEANPDYKPAWTYWSCNTPYDWDSDGGGHNCHDDTRSQMASLVYGNGHQMDPGSSYWCNGNDDSTDISTLFAGDQSGSPECDSNSSDGWQHPHTCQGTGSTGYNSAAGCYCDAACLDYNDCCIDAPR